MLMKSLKFAPLHLPIALRCIDIYILVLKKIREAKVPDSSLLLPVLMGILNTLPVAHTAYFKKDVNGDLLTLIENLIGEATTQQKSIMALSVVYEIRVITNVILLSFLSLISTLANG